MTDVAFHVNVPDPVAYACRLVRKAYLRGVSVLVLGDARQAGLVDDLLWAMQPSAFVPHCRGDAPPEIWARSPAVLVSAMAQAPQRPFDALLNLTPDVPPGYNAFARLFEVVSMAEADLKAARQRWRAYESDGLAPKKHEIAG